MPHISRFCSHIIYTTYCNIIQYNFIVTGFLPRAGLLLRIQKRFWEYKGGGNWAVI